MDKYEETDELINKIIASVIEDIYGGEFAPGAEEFIEVKDATINGRIPSWQTSRKYSQTEPDIPLKNGRG